MTAKSAHHTLPEKDRYFHGTIHLLVVTREKTTTVDALQNPIILKHPSI